MTGTYFKPIRRKLGVVTLMLACVFATGWVRSLSTEDTFGIGRNDFHSWIGSVSQQLTWLHFRMNEESRKQAGFQNGWQSRPIQHFVVTALNGSKWRWKKLGFEIDLGEFEIASFTARHPVQYHSIKAPFWAIVVPLTLLSAWLMLGKPQAGNATTSGIP